MPINNLSKFLYPREEQWLQRRRIKTIFYTVLVSVGFAGMVAAVMFFSNAKH